MPSSSGDVYCGGGCACAGNSVYQESLYLLFNFAVNPHCSKEKKSLKKILSREIWCYRLDKVLGRMYAISFWGQKMETQSACWVADVQIWSHCQPVKALCP